MIKFSNASFVIFAVFAIGSSVQGATTDSKQNNRSLRRATMKVDENDLATYRDLQTSKVEGPGVIKERVNHNEKVLKIQSCVDKLQEIVGNNNKGDHYLEPVEKIENCNKLCANQALTKGLLSPTECHFKCRAATDYESFEKVMKHCVNSDGELPITCEEVPGDCKCVQNCAIDEDAIFGESCNAYAPDGLNKGGGNNCGDSTLTCCCATPAGSCKEF